MSSQWLFLLLTFVENIIMHLAEVLHLFCFVAKRPIIFPYTLPPPILYPRKIRLKKLLRTSQRSVG